MGSTEARYPTPTRRRTSRYPSDTPTTALPRRARVSPQRAFCALTSGFWTVTLSWLGVSVVGGWRTTGWAMGRVWLPRGPVMEMDRRGELADVEERGMEWAGRVRVTLVGMVRGAEPM